MSYITYKIKCIKIKRFYLEKENLCKSLQELKENKMEELICKKNKVDKVFTREAVDMLELGKNS